MRQLHAIVWVYALLPFPDWAERAKVMLDNLRFGGSSLSMNRTHAAQLI